MNSQRTKIEVKVHPGASKNEVTGFRGDVLNVKITARPEKGKANTALVNCLSDVLGIAKSRITIARGSSSRTKTLEIEGMELQDIKTKLNTSG